MKTRILMGCFVVVSLFVALVFGDANLVGRWSFDEGSGTNTVDISGNNANGTLMGEPLPIWTSGVSSNALAFDGLQNEVQVLDAPSLTPTNAVTLMAWVRTATNLTSDVLGKWSTNELVGSYILGLTNGWVKLELILNGEPVTLIGGSVHLPSTNWNHIAGTYDGAQMVVYVNGQMCPNNRIVRLRFTGNRVTLPNCSSIKELLGVLPWKRLTS